MSRSLPRTLVSDICPPEASISILEIENFDSEFWSYIVKTRSTLPENNNVPLTCTSAVFPIREVLEHIQLCLVVSTLAYVVLIKLPINVPLFPPIWGSEAMPSV